MNPEKIEMERKVLQENALIAALLRTTLNGTGTLSLNFIGSPGAGKTAFLEKTLDILPFGIRAAVLTGDIQTENDAIRLRRFGYPVRQICSGGACHLDARMVQRHLEGWLSSETPAPDSPATLDLLLIENVGNLVCPTSYDLGEDAKIVVLSAAEGEDKPLKYPGIFRKSEVMILNKIDLLPHIPFDPQTACENALRIHPAIRIFEVSALTGAGFGPWIQWLTDRIQQKKTAPEALAVTN